MEKKEEGEASFDVVIVGAGLSGLTAANELLRRSSVPLRVAILEARNRVGGRTYTRTVRLPHPSKAGEQATKDAAETSDDLATTFKAIADWNEQEQGQELITVTVDMGAHWIGTHQKHVLELAKELGVEKEPQWDSGQKLLDLQGRVTKYTSDIPTNIGVFGLLDLQVMLWKFQRLESRIRSSGHEALLGSIATTPTKQSREDAKLHHWLDSMSCEEWIRQNAYTKEVVTLFEAAIRGVFGTEPAEVSLLWALLYARASGGIEKLINVRKGNQEFGFVGGSQQLSIKLATCLQQLYTPPSYSPSNYLRPVDSTVEFFFQSPVQSIHLLSSSSSSSSSPSSSSSVNNWTNGNKEEQEVMIIVQPKDNNKPRRIKAKKVVLAVSPAVAQYIEFVPRLPLLRARLQQKAFMGAITKCIVFYRTPFWREAGFSGEVVCDCATGPIHNVYDKSVTLSDGTLVPALVCFVNGGPAFDFATRPKRERQQLILQQLARWFGPKALDPFHFEEKDWQKDKWSRGCPISNFSSGALWQVGPALRRSLGPLHFGGTETAEEGLGFMDGAICSGKRVAKEIMNERNKPQKEAAVAPPFAAFQRGNEKMSSRSALLWMLSLLAVCVSWIVYAFYL